MTRYKYQAYDASGKVIGGECEAASRIELLERLHKSGLKAYLTTPIEDARRVWPLPNLFTRPELRSSDRARLARQLSTLLSASIPLDRALKLLEVQAADRKLKKCASIALDGVRSGQPLSSALQKGGAGFAADEIGIIKAGERTGATSLVMLELAEFLERRSALRAKLLSALVYPAILMVMALASLVVIGTVLVPNLLPLFEETKAELPLIVSVLIWSQAFIGSHWAILLPGCLIAAGSVMYLLRLPASQNFIAKALLQWPKLSSFTRKTETVRLTRTLATLLRSGVPLQSALASVSDVARNVLVKEQLALATDRVMKGGRLAESLKVVSALDEAALQMIAVGEETNQVEAMLVHVANQEEANLTQKIDGVMTLLTPLLTIAIGVMVGGLIMSIMRAILSINALAVP